MSLFRVWPAVWLLLAAGCSFNEGGLPTNDDGGQPVDASLIDTAVVIDANDIDTGPGDPDAMPDSMGPDPDAACVGDPLGFQPSNFTRCELATANGAQTFAVAGIWNLNGTTGMLTPPATPSIPLTFATIDQPGGPQLSVFTFTDFDLPVGVTLVVTSRPVALVSLDDIDINGTLTVGAVGASSGPGGNLDSLCAGNLGRGAPGGTDTTAFSDLAGRGGGGGGFGTVGGLGGPVNITQAAAGPMNGNSALVPLRGGCGGGDGGNPSGSGTGGAGGGAGGGLQLVAAGVITVGSATGRVTARGGGGVGSGAFVAGGGGGGSGGGLLFESGAGIVVNTGGVVAANGGAGGEGTRASANGGEGFDGSDIDGLQSVGGTSTSRGGDGGPGGADAGDADPGLIGESDDNGSAGAGGGGGAVGRIHFRSGGSIVQDGVISPDPQ